MGDLATARCAKFDLTVIFFKSTVEDVALFIARNPRVAAAKDFTLLLFSPEYFNITGPT
jgi:hypothetical protein